MIREGFVSFGPDFFVFSFSKESDLNTVFSIETTMDPVNIDPNPDL